MIPSERVYHIRRHAPTLLNRNAQDRRGEADPCPCGKKGVWAADGAGYQRIDHLASHRRPRYRCRPWRLLSAATGKRLAVCRFSGLTLTFVYQSGGRRSASARRHAAEASARASHMPTASAMNAPTIQTIHAMDSGPGVSNHCARFVVMLVTLPTSRPGVIPPENGSGASGQMKSQRLKASANSAAATPGQRHDGRPACQARKAPQAALLWMRRSHTVPISQGDLAGSFTGACRTTAPATLRAGDFLASSVVS